MKNQGQRVLSVLRQMIISGELKAGERMAEIPTAQQLGVSRMPVRIAFRTLEQEGLLNRLPRRGYRVRETSLDEISGAVEVRGVLEGLAAYQSAQRGLDEGVNQGLAECLEQGDVLFTKTFVTEDDLEVYHDLNKRFHRLIVEASANPAILAALARVEHIPFASVNALAIDPDRMDQEYRRFNYAHMQHHAVFDAIVQGQAGRAESVMREHAYATLRYVSLFHDSPAEGEDIRVIGSSYTLHHTSA